MLQKVLQAILRRYFGQFLTGLQNVELAFWTGKINIQNASFKHDKINQLIKTNHLPFTIKFSYIGSLQIDIPWNKLSSAPVQLIISDIFIVLKLQGITLNDLNDSKDDITKNSKYLLIKKYVQYMIKKSIQMKIQNNESGYLNRLIMKILHNMNIKISNISFRIQNQGTLNQQVYIKKQSQQDQQEEFSDVINLEDIEKQGDRNNQQSNIKNQKQISKNNKSNQRKLSQISSISSRRRRSTTINVSDKPFALGFCIKQFIAFTIDQKGQKRFINVQNQNVKFSKMIQLHQISFYWQQVMQSNMYNRSIQQRVNFLKNIIDRKQYRLLTIDGNVLLKKNHNQNIVMNQQKSQTKQYTYYLSSEFKQLSIQANYQQIKQMLLIVQTIKTQSQKVSIMKLKQLQKKQQLLLENNYKNLFINYLYPSNFDIQKFIKENNKTNQFNKNKQTQQSKRLQQIKKIFNGVQKKLLMKWTKQSLIQIIKKQKQQYRLKQKNKKGWFSFFSTQQSQITLDQNDFIVIEQQIKNLIAITQGGQQIKSFIKNLIIHKLTIKIKKSIKNIHFNKQINNSNKQINMNNDFSQQISLCFDKFMVKFMKYEKQSKLNINIKNVQLTYYNYKQNQKVQILQIRQKNQQVQSLLYVQSQFYDINNSNIQFQQMQQNYALQFKWQRIKQQTNKQKINLKIQPMKFKHQIKVLSFISYILKLRHQNKKMKSDLIIFKAQVQNSIPEEQIQLKDTIYEINIEIKRISLLIQLNESSFLKMYIDNITMDTIDCQQRNKHKIKMSNFGLKYIKKPLSNQNQIIKRVSQQSEIINDFSVDITTKGLKKIQTQITTIRIIICQDQMNSIYSCLINQSNIFTTQNKVYQKQKIIQHRFLEGKVSIINAFRVRYQYLAVLYSQSIALYSLKKGIQNLQQLILNSDQINPWQTIPLAKLKVSKISTKQLKLQSLFVNQILQLSNQSQIDNWIQNIQQRIFDFRARSQMHKLIQQQQKALQQNQQQNKQLKQTLNMIYKYQTQIIFNAQRIQVLYCKKTNQPFITIDIRQLYVLLEENNFTFQRNVKIMGIQIIDQELPNHVSFRKFLTNIIQNQNYQQINKDKQNYQNPIIITLSGKKKLHPNYTGQLQININIKQILINFNAQLLYTIIEKMTFKQPNRVLTPQQQNQFVLDYFYQILDSDQTKQLQDKIKNSQEIKDSSVYVDIQKFRQVFTCIVLLNLAIKVQHLKLYMIQGRTMQVPFVADVHGAVVNIDKGVNFLFVKAITNQLTIDDITGYPSTNTQPWVTKQKFSLVKTLSQRTSPNSVQLYYSSFPTQTIINKNRFRSFTHIVANDLQIIYQNQPLMRFIDYLTNQLILFFMEPPYLHRFDQKVRGQFKYGQYYFTKQQIQEYIRNIAVPFFNQLKVYANNLVAFFNTWPDKQAIVFHMDKVLIYPQNRLQSKRISYNVSQLISWQNKYQQFNKLSDMKSFQGNILKSHWSNRLIIKVQGMGSDIIKQKFDYQMYHQRCLHQQKQFLLPCIKLNKDMIQQAIVKNLTIIAPKNIYNLINKCFMFNLSYDDQLDCQYITNFQHQKKVPILQLVYKIRVIQFTLLIPQVNETVVLIQDMVYKWMRYPDTLKEMAVTGRAIHILGTRNFIIPIQNKQQNGLQYLIQMKPDGNKVMSTFFRKCQIIYDWDLFSQLLTYFLLDDSCYPPQKTYPDLPLITCHFYFLDSFIRLSKTQTHYYSLHGDITFSWIRMKLPHPQTYKEQRKNFPLGKIGSLYLAKIKQCTLKKFQKVAYQNHNFVNYRALSLPIALDMKWSNIMKISSGGHQYTDWIVEYDIKSLFLKLSYIDIQDLKKPFVKQNNDNQPPPPPVPYTQYVQHIFNFQKLTIQLGVSQLPVPLLDITFEGKIMIQLLDKTTAINLQINNLTSKYWNMLIGRWQPILQKFNATSNLKFSKTGVYIILDAPSIVYLDVSLDSLKVIKLISDDFSKKGRGVLNLIKKNMITDEFHISPYIITNRTSLTIHVSNHGKNSTSILNNEKLHLQTNFLQDANKLMGTIFIKIQDQIKLYEIDLNISSIVKTKVRYKDIDYYLYFQPISSPVVKQIIITSPYVLSNRTSHKVIVTLHNKEYYLNPDQKQAIPFYQIIQNKQFRIQFPHLNKPLQNYPFTFKDIQKGYQHYINLQGQQFNCTLSVKQNNQHNKDQQNFIQIQIAPVYYFKNLLPVDIVLQFNINFNNYNRLVTLKLGVNQQKQIYQINTIEDIMFRIQMKGYHFSGFVPLSKTDDLNYSPQQVILHDHRALDGKIKIKSVQQGKMRKVYMYSDAILINQTTQNLFTFSTNQLLSGQMVSQIPQSTTKYLMIDKNIDKVLNFGFEQNVPYVSNQFPTAQLGNQQLSMIKQNQYFQFTLNNTLQCLSNQAQIYCNVLKVMPKYIIVNSASRVFQLKQTNTQKVTHLMPGQRINWVWFNANIQQLLCFKPIDNQVGQKMGISEWDFSAGFNLQTIQDTVLVIRPKDKKSDDHLLLKIQVHKQYQQKFIVFKELISQKLNQSSQDFLIVQNDLKLARIQFYQNCFQSIQEPNQHPVKPFKAIPGDKTIFGWQDPQMPQQLKIKMEFLGPLRPRFRTQTFTVDVKDKNIIQKVFENNQGEIFQIQFVIETIGLKKKIRIRQKDLQQSVMQMDLLGGGNKIGLSFHELGISLISSGKNRKQVLYLSFKKFQIILMQQSQVRKIQVKIKYISIDNNLNHNTIYPVLFTPLKHQKTWTKSRPFFVMLIQTNLNKQATTQIKQFRMCLQSISLKIHDQVLIKIYDMYKQFGSNQKVDQNCDLIKIFRSNQKSYQWEEKQIKKLQNQIFFRQFQIAKLSIQISFSIRPKINKGNYLIFTILSSFGMAISNISQSQLTLSRFFKKQVTLTQLKNQMSQFYIKQFIKGIYKILGSITIFGNPYVFMRLVAEGAWEVVNQPTEGFIKGPIEGTIGIGKGGVFFARNVIAGTFNSFQAISQSLSRGISYMSLDEKFIQRRQKIKQQKSNHVFQGLTNGLFALYTGFQVAVTGLYRLPAQGYKKQGLGAGITGVLKGVTGLVTKPISGMFEGVSKLSQGIKNTALLFQDGPNTKRSRHPRVFLSNQKYYTNYNHLEAYTIAFLQHLSTKYLNIQILFISVTQNIQQNIMKSLVLTSKYLLIVDLIERSVQTQIVLHDIQTVEIIEQNIVRICTKYDDQIQIQEQPLKCQQIIQAFKMSKQFL